MQFEAFVREMMKMCSNEKQFSFFFPLRFTDVDAILMMFVGVRVATT
jgi:hypothetical protein